MGMRGSSREGRGEIELRERMWGETDRIKGHLRNNMETLGSGNFIKYMKVILMKSPNNGGYGVLAGHL